MSLQLHTTSLPRRLANLCLNYLKQTDIVHIGAFCLRPEEGYRAGMFSDAKKGIGGSCTHRARTVRTFDIHVFVLVTPGTDVFYNRASTGDRVPAIVLRSSPQPGDFLRIQYEVGGKVRK